MQTKKFKILEKEPYVLTAKNGAKYDKVRFKTDSDVLEFFAESHENRTLEIGKTYELESFEKQGNSGKVFINWRLPKIKNSLELRIEKVEKEVEALKLFLKNEPIDNVNAELAGEEDESRVNLADIPF